MTSVEAEAAAAMPSAPAEGTSTTPLAASTTTDPAAASPTGPTLDELSKEATPGLPLAKSAAAAAVATRDARLFGGLPVSVEPSASALVLAAAAAARAVRAAATACTAAPPEACFTAAARAAIGSAE